MCRHLEITESTWHRWITQYGRMRASDAERLKELDGQNAALKKLLAEAELDMRRFAKGHPRRWPQRS